MTKKELDKAMNEFGNAFTEYFKDKPLPSSEKERNKAMLEFTNWYNFERKQSDTGLTPHEMEERLIKKEPTSFETFKNEAEKYLAIRNYNNALETINKARIINPNDEGAIVIKINSLLGLKRIDDALKLCIKTQQTFGRTYQMVFCESNINLHYGNFIKAVKLMKEAYEINPDSYDITIVLANFLFIKKDPSYNKYLEAARKLNPIRAKSYEKASWLKPEEIINIAFFKKAMIVIDSLMQVNNTQEALENISILLDYKNNFPSECFEMVLGLEIECYFLEKELDIVKEKIEFLIKFSPKNPHAYFYKAQLLYNNLNLDEALKSINKCIEVAEAVSITHFDFYYLKSLILKSMNNEDYKIYEEMANNLKNHNDKNGYNKL